MNVADFDYELPPCYIAQRPAEPRDAARLLRLDRMTGKISHHVFRDIEEFLAPNDVLVLNNTRVIPARLQALKSESGGKVEILLLRQIDDYRWSALVGGRNVRKGMRLVLANSDVSCDVIRTLEKSRREIEFNVPVHEFLDELGQVPLPPYINTKLEDSERYQTVYSSVDGSAAAPTAGLHFTPALLSTLRRRGVRIAYCTLHIGLDTFQPVTVARVQEHEIHSEYATLDEGNARIINEGKLLGGRIIAVGTTSARTLETAGILSAGGDPANPAQLEDTRPRQTLEAFQSNTELFIYPGYKWRAVDAMITNFHLPRSTLLMMLSAFVGRETLLSTYETAKQMHYRFYSLGDAMFIA